MSLTLTQTNSDNFTRANESPLVTPPWTVVGQGLQIVSNLCEATVVSGNDTEVYSGTALAADQYAAATISNMSADGSDIFLFVRLQANNNDNSGYELLLQKGSASSSYQLFSVTGGSLTSILFSSGITISNGDVWAVAVVGSTLYVVRNGTVLGTVTNTTWSSGSFSGLGIQTASALTDVQLSLFSIGTASNASTFSISGNAGVASATVSYSGAAIGSVTADGSGNYTIPGLLAGNYTITPSLAGYSFSPTSLSVTITSSNLTNENFTAMATPVSQYWSQPDCRVAVPGFGPGPNTGVVVNGTIQYTGQVSDNHAIPPVDSRANKPVSSGTPPQNNRNNPTGI
jgi:hypothetical protein